MSVSSPEELRALQAAGRVVADTIRAMRRADAPRVSTADASVSAHVEHTIVVRDGAPLVLTA